MSDIRDRLQSRLTELQKEEEERKSQQEKEDKSILGTLSGGLQLLGQGALRGVEGVFVDTPLWLAANAKKLFGDKEGAETLAEASRIDLTNMLINAAGGKETNPYLTGNQNLWNKEELNKTSYVTDENLGGKVISGVGEMLPTIALGGMGGKGVANLSLGANAFSGGANQAFDEGATIGQSTLYGLSNAGIELLTERISGGIPGLKKIQGTTTYDLLKNYTKDILGEGIEEMISEIANPAAQALTYKGRDALQQYTSGEYWKGVLEAGLIGSLTGAILDSPNISRGATDVSTQQIDTQPKAQSDTQVTLPNVKEVPIKQNIETEKVTDATDSKINIKNGKLIDKSGKEVIFNRLHPDYQNITDDYNYDNSTFSHNTGYGLTFMDDNSYIKGKPEKDVLRSTINTKGLLTSDSNVKINNNIIDKLNNIVSSRELGIPDAFTYDDTESSLIDKINFVSNMVGENMGNNAGRKVYVELYNTLGKDGYLLQNPNGSHTLSVVSRNNINSLKQSDKITVEPETKKPLVKETKTETKKSITPSELTNKFKSIEDSYTKANKYTGEIKADLLKTTQKEYNKYRDSGGDKIISALEENYQAKQKIAKALNKETTQDNMYTPDQARVSKMRSESFINKYQKTIDSKSTKAAKLAEMKKIVDRYIEDVSKGMEPIEQYEKWKNELDIHESANKTINNEANETFKEIEKEVNEEVKVVTQESVTGDGVIDEELNIDTDGIDDILDEIEILEIELGEPPKNATFNKVYNEQQKTLAKKGASGDKLLEKLQDALIAKGKLDKKYAEKGGTAVIQWLLDDQYSLRRIDKQNKNNKIANAMRQKNKALVLANASINGKNLVDINFNPTDIVSESEAWKPLTDLPVDTRFIGYEYITLQQEYFHKINNELYGIPHEDNIFRAYSTDDIVQKVTQIEDTYPELVNLIKKDVMPNVRKIVYKMNQMEIETDTRNAKTEITKEFAINEMNMSEADIKAHTVGKKILVDTADFYMAANPWYIPIEREVIKTYSGEGSKAQSGISKPKTRKADADQAIQPLAEGMAEKMAKSYVNMKNNQARKAIAENWSNITENKIITYQKTDGKLGSITKTGDGDIQMTYLANNDKGQLVNKTINITKNMENAYNGFDENIKAFRETKLGKALQYKSRIQRNLLTKWNLPWQGANVMRDVSDALLNNEFDIKGNGGFVKNVFGAYMVDAANNTETFQEFSSYKGTYLTQNEATGYLDNKTSLSKALSKVDSMLETGELMTRYALYKTAREAGYSIEEAQRVSDEGTTDFTKSGSIWKLADNLGITVFLAPSVAGVNRFIDTTIKPYADAVKVLSDKIKQDGLKLPSKQSYDAYDKKVLKRAATQLIKTSLIFGLGRELLRNLFDDEESQKQIANLSDTEIQNNVIIPIQGGVIKIPKGRIWRAYDAISDLASDDTIRDEDKMDLVETLSYVWDSVGVSGIDSSTTSSNLMSILKNEDYYGNQIYSDSAVSKETFDYLLKQYGSIYYKTFQYVNGGTDKNPWVSNFYTDTTTVSSYNNRFYNMKDAYSTTYDKSVGTFKSNDDMQNYFAYRVINYEKSSGELSVELAKLKALKADSTSTTEQIREQEAKVQNIYQDIFSYIDNNQAVDYSIAQDGSVIKYGTNYRFTKNSEGSYTKAKK